MMKLFLLFAGLSAVVAIDCILQGSLQQAGEGSQLDVTIELFSENAALPNDILLAEKILEFPEQLLQDLLQESKLPDAGCAELSALLDEAQILPLNLKLRVTLNDDALVGDSLEILNISPIILQIGSEDPIVLQPLWNDEPLELAKEDELCLSSSLEDCGGLEEKRLVLEFELRDCSAPLSAMECCINDESCGVGQGDCDQDSDCLDDLVCGQNNCQKLNADLLANNPLLPDEALWQDPLLDCCQQVKPDRLVCDERKIMLVNSEVLNYIDGERELSVLEIHVDDQSGFDLLIRHRSLLRFEPEPPLRMQVVSLDSSVEFGDNLPELMDLRVQLPKVEGGVYRLEIQEFSEELRGPVEIELECVDQKDPELQLAQIELEIECPGRLLPDKIPKSPALEDAVKVISGIASLTEACAECQLLLPPCTGFTLRGDTSQLFLFDLAMTAENVDPSELGLEKGQNWQTFVLDLPSG
jgi:hypothetical protein